MLRPRVHCSTIQGCRQLSPKPNHSLCKDVRNKTQASGPGVQWTPSSEQRVQEQKRPRGVEAKSRLQGAAGGHNLRVQGGAAGLQPVPQGTPPGKGSTRLGLPSRPPSPHEGYFLPRHPRGWALAQPCPLQGGAPRTVTSGGVERTMDRKTHRQWLLGSTGGKISEEASGESRKEPSASMPCCPHCPQECSLGVDIWNPRSEAGGGSVSC